ncbi:MAG: hypothetical protein R3C40_00475 [Parvularculaceae bacterium]
MRELIGEGRLGFKSNEGFQKWSETDQAVLRKRLTDHLVAANRARE